MGIRAWLARLGAALTRLWLRLWHGRGGSINDLARRLNVPEATLTALTPARASR